MKNGSLELDSWRVRWNEEAEEPEEAGDRRITSVRALSLSCSVYRGNQIGTCSVERTCFSFIILCRHSRTEDTGRLEFIVDRKEIN